MPFVLHIGQSMELPSRPCFLISHLPPVSVCVHVCIQTAFDVIRRSYLDKTISLHLNKGRKVSGTLRGYDQFMNIVLGDAIEETSGAAQNRIGMVVIRGNSIVQFELLK